MYATMPFAQRIKEHGYMIYYNLKLWFYSESGYLLKWFDLVGK